MKLILRDTYLNELSELINTPDIKIITGIRRSGKSKLLEALKELITASDPSANIIHINYNLTEFEELLEYHMLESYVEDKYSAEDNNYVLIDEIQMCEHFEKAVNSLHAKEKYDIYVTGSNAFLQSQQRLIYFSAIKFRLFIYINSIRCSFTPS